MCKNPMWRIPCSEELASSIFIPGYRNGGYIIPVSNVDKFNKVLHKIELRLNSTLKYNMLVSEITQIGCGKCVECRLNDSKEWAQRAVAESMCHSENWFITLTYDNEHLPPPILTYSRHSYDFGEWSPLLYEHFQGFMKRLLSRLRYVGIEDVRFFMCGEYGPKNGRPHFHCILYNCPIPDLKKLTEVTLGGKTYSYLTSDLIEEAWGNGFITIGQVSWESSAYVARYVLKKMTPLEEYDYQKLCTENGWEFLPPEMRQASRRPGLGRPFFEDHKDDIYEFDKVVLSNGKACKPCAYFDNIYDIEHPGLLHAIKEHRREKAFLAQCNEEKQFNSKQAYKEYKDKKYEALCRRLKKLHRDL